jgi:hypothetical protein
MFATAKAQATASGRPAGVWLELERIGDPTTGLGLYQCSQLYLAEVPLPYSGDVLGAKVIVWHIANGNPQMGVPALGSGAQLAPWLLQFPGSPGAYALYQNNQAFSIRFDFKADLYYGITRSETNVDDDFDGSTDEQGEFGFYLYGRGGADGEYGVKNIDDNGNGIVDRDILTGPDVGEYGAKGSDDIVFMPPTAMSTGYGFQLYRQPQRAGQPLELPQGIVIDLAYSGIGPSSASSVPSALNPVDFAAAKQALIVMFSPGGGVASVAYIEQMTGNSGIVEDTGSSKVFFLVGKTEKMDFPWNPFQQPTPPYLLPSLADSNIADGSNRWVVVNRRNGSIATVENTPSPLVLQNNPPTPAERQLYMTTAREFARTGEVTGGQ